MQSGEARFLCSCQLGSIPGHKSQFCRAANLFVRLYIHGRRICSICLYLSSKPTFCSKLVSCHQLSLSLSQQRLLPFPTTKVPRWYILPGLNHLRRGNITDYFFSSNFLQYQPKLSKLRVLKLPQQLPTDPLLIMLCYALWHRTLRFWTPKSAL